MSDLVERLRSYMGKADMGDVLRDCREAADRIEALEAALHKIDDITIDHTAMGIARKALASAALAPEQDK
jgi:hypothetical protein